MTEPKPKPPEMVGCRDECGAKIERDKVEQWERGEITGRYRCPDCKRMLDAVARIERMEERGPSV